MLRIMIAILALVSCCKSVPLVEEPAYMESAYQGEAEEPKFGIILLGDTGEPGKNQAIVAKAIESFCMVDRCSIGLLLGDNFYDSGVKSVNDPLFKSAFEEPYKNLKFKFYPVIGNHDARGNWKAQVEYNSDHWHMGGQYYSLDGGWVDLYALDTNWTPFQRSHHGKPQREWLESELGKATPQWKIVYGHHPVFSSGWHGGTWALQRYLKPMLEKNAVDFYIAGHDHNKELIEKDGVKYIVSGTGAKLRSIRKAGKYTVFSKSSLGFAHLLLTKKTAILKFVNENGEIEFEKEYQK